MHSFDEIKHVVLKDKRQIILNDDGAFSLSVVWNKKELFQHPMDYPEAGYGGRALYLSPDNSYLLFACYSGQSEEGVFPLQNWRQFRDGLPRRVQVRGGCELLFFR